MPAFFARSIAMVDSDLADAIAVVPWKGGSQQLEDSAIDAADAVIVYGSSQTLEAVVDRAVFFEQCQITDGCGDDGAIAAISFFGCFDSLLTASTSQIPFSSRLLRNSFTNLLSVVSSQRYRRFNV